MRKGIIHSSMLGVLALAMIATSCNKENSIGEDNDQVVEIPYTLFMADTNGSVINTNDGTQYNTIFPPDGYNNTILATSGDNLLMLKANLHLSVNASPNFNPVFLHVNKFPWQSTIYDFAPANRIYITSTDGNGVSYSEDHGQTWKTDAEWIGPTFLPPSFEVSSFAGLADGRLYAYSNDGNVLFEKDQNATDGNWTPVAIQGTFPVVNSSYYLTSNDNVLFLVDYNGVGGALYSEDGGQNWTKYPQGNYPTGTKAVSACGAFSTGTSLLIGTKGKGVYRSANGGPIIGASGGLEIGTTAFSMARKQNKFKNNQVKAYVYLGTNFGLYRSENGGDTWYSVTTNPWVRSYVAVY